MRHVLVQDQDTRSPKAPGPRAPELSRPQRFGDHNDINGNTQNKGLGIACAGSALQNMKAGSKPIEFQVVVKWAPYHYAISWIDGCKTTATTQNVWQPLADKKDVTCFTLLRQDWEMCKWPPWV